MKLKASTNIGIDERKTPKNRNLKVEETSPKIYGCVVNAPKYAW